MDLPPGSRTLYPGKAMRAAVLALLLAAPARAALTRGPAVALLPHAPMPGAELSTTGTLFDGSVRRLESAPERIEAFKLAHDRYVERGYMTPHPSGVRVTPWDLQPHTAAFGAYEDGRLAMALSLVPDGPEGLPSESVFGPEIERLRREPRAAHRPTVSFARPSDRRWLGEITGLAAGEAERSARALKRVVSLSRLIVLYGWALELTDVVISVNPHHALFYRRALDFTPLAPDVRTHQGVGAPAVALHLPIERVLDRPSWFDRGPLLPWMSTAPQPERDLREFARLRDGR